MVRTILLSIGGMIIMCSLAAFLAYMCDQSLPKDTDHKAYLSNKMIAMGNIGWTFNVSDKLDLVVIESQSIGNKQQQVFVTVVDTASDESKIEGVLCLTYQKVKSKWYLRSIEALELSIDIKQPKEEEKKPSSNG